MIQLRIRRGYHEDEPDDCSTAEALTTNIL